MSDRLYSVDAAGGAGSSGKSSHERRLIRNAGEVIVTAAVCPVPRRARRAPRKIWHRCSRGGPAHVVVGFLLALTASIGLAWPAASPLPAPLNGGAACIAAVVLFWAAVMLWSSLVAKKRIRDRLVAALALSGNERVLD
jgi:hypothetical protein